MTKQRDSWIPLFNGLKRGLLIFSPLLFAACVAEPENTVPEDTTCQAPLGLTLSDIESVTDWINELPKPTSLPCFLESLPRPLEVNMTQSVFSAQPSLGRHNPRIFIFYDKLILSVVPEHDFGRDEEDGTIVDLLEVAYVSDHVSPNPNSTILTVKGEYKFPINETIPYSNPYEHLPFGSISICGVCHAHEEQIGSFDGYPVYVSELYQPFANLAVTIESMLIEHQNCEEAIQPFRCNMLSGLFDHGDMYRVEFPENAHVFD